MSAFGAEANDFFCVIEHGELFDALPPTGEVGPVAVLVFPGEGADGVVEDDAGGGECHSHGCPIVIGAHTNTSSIAPSVLQDLQITGRPLWAESLWGWQANPPRVQVRHPYAHVAGMGHGVVLSHCSGNSMPSVAASSAIDWRAKSGMTTDANVANKSVIVPKPPTR